MLRITSRGRFSLLTGIGPLLGLAGCVTSADSDRGVRAADIDAQVEAAAADARETDAPWIELFDGRSLGSWASTSFGGEGEVRLRDGAIELPFGSNLTGVHWTGAPLPPAFEIEVLAARTGGSDFFCGLTFPVGDSFASVVLGGWGGGLCGLSCVDGRDASDNPTRSLRGFVTGQDYLLRVRVDDEAVEAWLDGEPLLRQERRGHTFELRPEVLNSRPLGVASFATSARVRALRLRPLGPSPRPGPGESGRGGAGAGSGAGR